MNNPPFVSVIIPAFNAEKTIRRLIESLGRQTYPQHLYEIIIIDNNSTDNTEKILRNYPVKFYRESAVQSSYAARNLGVQHARGEILAFIDADCIAAGDWIEKGIRALHTQAADLAGGNVEFIFSEKRTASEIYDAITHLNTGMNIAKIRAAGTANLFVNAEVFQKIGLFPQDVHSGGDMQFTHKATTLGHKLIFASEANVRHPARTFRELLKKSYRIGTGCVAVMAARGLKKPDVIRTMLRDFLPPTPFYIRRLIRERGTADMHKEFMKIFGISCLNRLVRGLGMMSRMSTLFRKRERVSP